MANLIVEELRKLLDVPPPPAGSRSDPTFDELAQSGVVSFRPHAHEKQFTIDNPVETVRDQRQASIALDNREHKAIRRRARKTAAAKSQLFPAPTDESFGLEEVGEDDGINRSASKRREDRRRKSRARKQRAAAKSRERNTQGSARGYAEQFIPPLSEIEAGALEEDTIMPAGMAPPHKRTLNNDYTALRPQKSLFEPFKTTVGNLSAAAANFVTRHSPLSPSAAAPPRQSSATPSHQSSGAMTLVSQLNFSDPVKLQDDLTNVLLHEQVDEAEHLLRRLERNYVGTDPDVAVNTTPPSDLQQFQTRKTATDYTAVAADEASLRIHELFTTAGVDSYQDLVVYIAKRTEQLENTSDRLAAEVSAVQTEVLSLRNVRNNLQDEVELLQARRAHLFDESVTKQKNKQEQEQRDKELVDSVVLGHTKPDRVLDIDQLQTAYRRQAVLLRKRHNFRSSHYKQSHALRQAEDAINAQLARSMALEKAAANRMVAIGEQLKSQHRQMHTCRHEITLLRQEVNAYVLDFDEQDNETPTTAGDNDPTADKKDPVALDFDEIGRMLERQDMKTFFMLRTEPLKMLDNIGEDMDRNAELIEQCSQKASLSSRRVMMQLEQLASLYKNFQDYLRRHNIVHIPENIWLEYRRIERQPRATAHALQTAVHTYEALTYSIKCLVDCIQSSRDLVVDEQVRHAGDQHRFQYIKRMADNGAKIFAYQERLAAKTGLGLNKLVGEANFGVSDEESDDASFFEHTSWDNEAVKLAELDSFYSIQHE